MKHATAVLAGFLLLIAVASLFANQQQAATYARLDLRFEQVSADLENHREALASAEVQSARVDTILSTDTLIINLGIVQAQRFADSIGALLPRLALAANAADSLPIVTAMLDARTLQTIEQTRTISVLLRDNELLAQDRAMWHGLALSGDSVQADVMGVLEGERAARSCFVVCVPKAVKYALVAAAAFELGRRAR